MERIKPKIMSDIFSLPDPLGTLRKIIPEGILNKATQGGTFDIPERGPGSYSIPNALKRQTSNKDPQPTTLQQRRQWNSNHQMKGR